MPGHVGQQKHVARSVGMSKAMALPQALQAVPSTGNLSHQQATRACQTPRCTMAHLIAMLVRRVGSGADERQRRLDALDGGQADAVDVEAGHAAEVGRARHHRWDHLALATREMVLLHTPEFLSVKVRAIHLKYLCSESCASPDHRPVRATCQRPVMEARALP